MTNDGQSNEIGPDYAQLLLIRNMTNPYYRSALEEKFPRIADKVVLMWGYPEIITFFESLTLDDRGDRDGFSPDVMSELVFLSALHDIAYPFKKAEKGYANRGGGYSFDLD